MEELGTLKHQRKLISFLNSKAFKEELVRNHGRIKVSLADIVNFNKEDRDALYVVNDAIATIAVGAEEQMFICFCGQEFKTCALLLAHALGDHLESHLAEPEEFLGDKFQQELPKEWNDELMDCDYWEPVDIGSASEDNGDVLVSSDDSERTVILGEVVELFRTLLQNKVLHIDHLQEMLDYAMNVVDGKRLRRNGVDNKSPLCFLCLDTKHLRYMRRFLKKLVRKGNIRSSVDGIPKEEVKERMIIDLKNAAVFVSGEQWLTDTNIDAKGILDWVYDSDSGQKVFTVLNEIYLRVHKLRILRNKHDSLTRYQDTLIHVETACHGSRSVLKSRRKFIEKLSDDEFQRYYKSIAGTPAKETSRRMDFIHAIDSVTRTAKHMHGTNSNEELVTKAFDKEKKRSRMKVHINTVRLLKNLAAYKQLKHKLASVSSITPATSVKPMLKKYLQMEWERRSSL